MRARVLIAICVLLATATARRRRPTTTTPAGPAGYIYKAATGSFYKYYSTTWLSWEGAKSTCAYDGGHLVVLNDATEAEVVADVVRDITGVHHLTWSGLSDKRPGGVVDWRTVLGEPLSEVYNVWEPEHPKNNPEWTCTLYDASTKQLVDAPCNYNYHFICEICQHAGGHHDS